jgi:hypothetical protein
MSREDGPDELQLPTTVIVILTYATFTIPVVLLYPFEHTKTNRLIPFRVKIDVNCENHKKHTMHCVGRMEFRYVKSAGTFSNHWVLEG